MHMCLQATSSLNYLYDNYNYAKKARGQYLYLLVS